MPNHVINTITFSAKYADLVFEKVINEKGNLDFGTLVPMPLNVYQGDLANYKPRFGTEERIDDEKDFPNNWYDWQCKNWGTKWNAYGCKNYIEGKVGFKDSKGVLEFQTAWAPPFPFVTAFANYFKFPFDHEVRGEVGENERLTHKWDLKKGKMSRVTVLPSTAIYENRYEDEIHVVDELGIPEFQPDYKFFFQGKKNKTLIAVNYRRVVFGDHGPYLEFERDQIVAKLRPKFDKELPATAFYEWMVPVDDESVKVYDQKKDVKHLRNPPKGGYMGDRVEGYADYIPGFYYISPKDVCFITTKGLQIDRENYPTVKDLQFFLCLVQEGETFEQFEKETLRKLSELQPVLKFEQNQICLVTSPETNAQHYVEYMAAKHQFKYDIVEA